MIRGKDYRSMWEIESIIKNMSVFGILFLTHSEDPLLCQQILKVMMVTFTEELQTV